MMSDLFSNAWEGIIPTSGISSPSLDNLMSTWSCDTEGRPQFSTWSLSICKSRMSPHLLQQGSTFPAWQGTLFGQCYTILNGANVYIFFVAIVCNLLLVHGPIWMMLSLVLGPIWIMLSFGSWSDMDHAELGPGRCNQKPPSNSDFPYVLKIMSDT